MHLQKKYYRDTRLAIDYNTDLRTILLVAEQNPAECNKLIKSLRDNIDLKNDQDDTLLAISLYDQMPNVVSALIKAGANVNYYDRYCQSTFLMICAWNDYKDLAAILLDGGADINTTQDIYGTALGVATLNNNADFVKLLIDYGADVNMLGDYSKSPLEIAVENDNIQITKMLINAGANTNTQSVLPFSSLHVAAKHSNLEIVKILIQNHAEINACVFRDGTPLDCVQDKDGAGKQIFDLLKQNGAKTEEELDAEAQMAVDYLLAHIPETLSSIFEILYINPEPLKEEPYHNKWIFDITRKIDSNYLAPYNMLEYFENNKEDQLLQYAILNFAVWINADHIVIAFLENGVSFEVPIVDGKLPLHFACQTGNFKMVNELIERISGGIDKVDGYGKTPIFYACDSNSPETILFLIHAYAGVNDVISIYDKQISLLDYAISNNCSQDVINLLILYGADTYEDIQRERYDIGEMQ